MASCSTWSISRHRSLTSFLGDSLLCSFLLPRQEGLEAAEQLVLGRRRWLVSPVPVWEGGGHLLLAGSGQLPLPRVTGMVTIVLPLRFAPMVYVKSSQPRTREGEGGLPSPAAWTGNNDPFLQLLQLFLKILFKKRKVPSFLSAPGIFKNSLYCEPRTETLL